MTNLEITEKLKSIVKPYSQNKEGLANFTNDTTFINDLEINSANLVDVILDVEDEFNITIDNNSMEGMLNVGDSIRIINEKLAEK